MVAGTITMRTTVASRSTATARPNPNRLIARSTPSTKLPNTTTMMAAAAVMTLPVAASPLATAIALSPVRSLTAWVRPGEGPVVPGSSGRGRKRPDRETSPNGGWEER